MRLEYTFELTDVDLPRFSVEAVEGIAKLFTLASLVLNVLQTRRPVQLVFHGINPEDPTRKIDAFQEILRSAPNGPAFTLEAAASDRVHETAAYYRWVTIRPT
jgi:hypothetical protein